MVRPLPAQQGVAGQASRAVADAAPGVAISVSEVDRIHYARDLWPRHHLAVRDGQLVLHDFQQDLRAAATRERAGQLIEATEHIERALGMWRGPTLDGVVTPALESAERRIEGPPRGAVEWLTRLRLELGHHGEGGHPVDAIDHP